MIYVPINLLDNKLGPSFFKMRNIPIIISSNSKNKYIVPTKKIAKLLTIFPIIPVPSIPIIPNNIINTPTSSLLYY